MKPDINLLYVTGRNQMKPQMVFDSSKKHLNIDVNVQFYGISSGIHTVYIDLKNKKNESILINQKPSEYIINYDEVTKNEKVSIDDTNKDKPNLIGSFTIGFGLNEIDITNNEYINIVGIMDNNPQKQTKIFFGKA